MSKPKYADYVLYLDFDGGLHDAEAYITRKRGIELRTPGRTLFEWMPILEDILATISSGGHRSVDLVGQGEKF